MTDPYIRILLFTFGAIVLSLATSAGSPAHAQAVMQSDLDRCMDIADASDRLACFEHLATANKASGPAAAVDKKGSSQSVPQPKAPAAPRMAKAPTPPALSGTSGDNFGLKEKPSPKERADTLRQVTLASAKRDPRGHITMTMQNGQIWRQTDKSPIIMPSAGDSALIEKGFLGGYSMRINKRTIRVERLK